jgi:hypothetical protein
MAEDLMGADDKLKPFLVPGDNILAPFNCARVQVLRSVVIVIIIIIIIIIIITVMIVIVVVIAVIFPMVIIITSSSSTSSSSSSSSSSSPPPPSSSRPPVVSAGGVLAPRDPAPVRQPRVHHRQLQARPGERETLWSGGDLVSVQFLYTRVQFSYVSWVMDMSCDPGVRLARRTVLSHPRLSVTASVLG